jgi:hypothetical protein
VLAVERGFLDVGGELYSERKSAARSLGADEDHPHLPSKRPVSGVADQALADQSADYSPNTTSIPRCISASSRFGVVPSVQATIFIR